MRLGLAKFVDLCYTIVILFTPLYNFVIRAENDRHFSADMQSMRILGCGK